MSESKSNLAVVLLSGGLDSATALAIARGDGYACHALSFDYGQRHRFELRAAGQVARSLGAVEHRVVHIDLTAQGGFGRSALTDDIAVPKGQADAARIPVTYVPARNTIFLSIALVTRKRSARSTSHRRQCRRLQRVPRLPAGVHRSLRADGEPGHRGGGGRTRKFHVRTPLIHMSKAQIIRTGLGLGVDYSMTHSCYDPAADGPPAAGATPAGCAWPVSPPPAPRTPRGIWAEPAHRLGRVGQPVGWDERSESHLQPASCENRRL